MKLLKLRIENVNSLGGVHEIDFRAPEFRESGIFAICGPTGSGKTSILDAVTLALYGTTPRMEERVQTAKKDDACMVLTKNTDQTSAQVTFESFGAVYRSRWSRRVKRTGKISGDEVELVRLASPDAVDGEIIAEQKSEWKLALERILGMNLKAFTRSAMLAQGAFAELLRANNRDRADILEKITGTEIYTLIGERVFERMTDLKQSARSSGARERERPTPDAQQSPPSSSASGRRRLRRHCFTGRMPKSSPQRPSKPKVELTSSRNPSGRPRRPKSMPATGFRMQSRNSIRSKRWINRSKFSSFAVMRL